MRNCFYEDYLKLKHKKIRLNGKDINGERRSTKKTITQTIAFGAKSRQATTKCKTRTQKESHTHITRKGQKNTRNI